MSPEIYRFLASLLLSIHTLIVVTMLAAIVLGFAGYFRRHPKLGWLSAGFVAGYFIVDLLWWPYCPITLAEQHLLSLYNPADSYQGSCIVHWFNVVLHINVPLLWVHEVQYVCVGLYVLLAVLTVYRWRRQGVLGKWYCKGKQKLSAGFFRQN